MTQIYGPYLDQGVPFTQTDTAALSTLVGTSNPVYVKITDAQTSQSVYLDLNKIVTFEPGISVYLTLTLTAFLNAWYIPSSNKEGIAAFYGNPAIRDIPDAMSQGMIYSFNPLMDPTLSVLPVSINAPDKTDPTYQPETKNDVVITGTRDLSNCFITVNGVFHNTIYWDKNQYVIDGMYSFRQNQKFDIQCFDTSSLGGHTVVPITPDMVVWDADQQGIILTLPAGQTFTGKTPFTAIDGYLFYPDEILTVVSPTQAFIRTARIPFISQWRHNPLTKRSSDIVGENWLWGNPAFPDTVQPPVVTGSYRSINQQPDLNLFVDTRFVPITSVNTPTFRMTRVSSPHSAIILINKPSLTHQVVTPYPTQITNRYGVTTASFPQGIARYGCGLCPSYATTATPFNETWIFVTPQDYDIDRDQDVLYPDCIPAIFPQMEESLRLPFSIHVFS